jgi:N-acetylglucosaminyldiphosphoundecaprenol N-acetyl-beta-D-mannosaminyltransferase
MKINLFNISIDNLTMEESLQRIEGFVNSGISHQHVVVNVNKVIKADKDKRLREVINRCDLINVDGAPLVWFSKILGKPLKMRVAGTDLFFSLIEMAERKSWKLYFLGAKIKILKKAMDILRTKYPSLRIAGYRNGYWAKEEERKIAEDIKNAQPDILFVGISSPKKEYFLSEYLEGMRVPFVMGVGGSFDILAGEAKRAPVWMQRCGLEWFFRFLQEPKRLFKRYFIEGTGFANLCFRELFFRKRIIKTY